VSLQDIVDRFRPFKSLSLFSTPLVRCRKVSNFAGWRYTSFDATHLYTVGHSPPRVLEATGDVFQRSYRIVTLSLSFSKGLQTPGVIATVTVGDIHPAEKTVQP